MNTRRLLLALVAAITVSTASADIEVVSAYYGRQSPERTIKVTDAMQKRFDSGIFRFRLSPAVMGLDPNPGRQNFLVVEYKYGGQKGFARAGDGEVFALPGFGSVPQPAAGTSLRIENNFARALYVYQLDRWGAWQWKARLDKGAAYKAVAKPGENWVVIDQSGRVVRQIRVTSQMAPIYLR